MFQGSADSAAPGSTCTQHLNIPFAQHTYTIAQPSSKISFGISYHASAPSSSVVSTSVLWKQPHLPSTLFSTQSRPHGNNSLFRFPCIPLLASQLLLYTTAQQQNNPSRASACLLSRAVSLLLFIQARRFFGQLSFEPQQSDNGLGRAVILSRALQL